KPVGDQNRLTDFEDQLRGERAWHADTFRDSFGARPTGARRQRWTSWNRGDQYGNGRAARKEMSRTAMTTLQHCRSRNRDAREPPAWHYQAQVSDRVPSAPGPIAEGVDQ